MDSRSRRDFLKQSLAMGVAAASLGGSDSFGSENKPKPGSKMKWGLVTYLWAQDWDLPTLIANCEKSGTAGVELRTEHKHGVEPTLSAAERAEVKKRFADSPVALLGPGTNECFDNPDPAIVAKAIEATKAFLRLSYDCGGSGVKVKPNSFHPGVPREQTIEQIGKALNVVAAYGSDYGQQVRLEVHGTCCELPTIKAIMDVATHPNATVCWNSNPQDLEGEGLEHNFNLVKDRFGATCHVWDMIRPDYPVAKLMALFVAMDYDGAICLEARTQPEDKVAALIEQRRIFEEMVAKAQVAL